MSGTVDAARPARVRRLKVIALVIVVVGIAVDLWSKAYMQDLLVLAPRAQRSEKVVEVIPGLFRFEGLWNPGVTFGLAQGWTESILAFTAVASGGILAWLLLTRSRSRLLHVALGMILAGALGNLYDRWKWQEVRDFLLVYWKDPSVWHWPAFNVADSMIVVGVGFILGIELFGRRGAAPSPAPKEQSA